MTTLYIAPCDLAHHVRQQCTAHSSRTSRTIPIHNDLQKSIISSLCLLRPLLTCLTHPCRPFVHWRADSKAQISNPRDSIHFFQHNHFQHSIIFSSPSSNDGHMIYVPIRATTMLYANFPKTLQIHRISARRICNPLPPPTPAVQQ